MDKESLNEIKKHISFSYESIYLFGSQARGDHSDKSDIDILIVTRKYEKAFNVDKYGISPYTIEQLVRLANDGSLFVLHLIKESIFLEGVDCMQIISSKFIKPLQYDFYRAQLRNATALLDIDNIFFYENCDKILRIQKFILRSYIYSLSVDNMFLNFNINSALEYIDLPYLTKYFNQDWSSQASFEDFKELNANIEILFDCKITNKYKSTEALLVNNYPLNNLIFILGKKLANKNNMDLGYETITIHGK